MIYLVYSLKEIAFPPGFEGAVGVAVVGGPDLGAEHAH